MIMQTPGTDGYRVPFHLLFLTADRSAWNKKIAMKEQLAGMNEDDPGYAALKEGIEKIHCGGRIIEHDNCVISRPRGMHAKRLAEKAGPPTKNPNSNDNRTRNIVFRPSDQIRKMHNSLLFKFNHEDVIY